MVAMTRRWHRPRAARSNKVIMMLFFLSIIVILFYMAVSGFCTERCIELVLEEALKEDTGTGCTAPKLDPFSNEITQFDKPITIVKCKGDDWVTCWLSECKVKKHILEKYKEVVCQYRDILYQNDTDYHIGPPRTLKGDQVYILINSDHVKVHCVDKPRIFGFYWNLFHDTWSGNLAGFRIKSKFIVQSEKTQTNVLILGFDSATKNGFIRRMAKSYQVLREELNAVVLKSYGVLGDGTPASLFPMLTGKTAFELLESRKLIEGSEFNDVMSFIFYKLREYGYRTAYFEDMPWIGTFQYRFRGFRRQPADHYLRAFLLEEFENGKKWSKSNKFCVGDTPTYKFMLNITEQFFHLDGKRFAFTFISDITHDEFNMISTADETFAEFLRNFKAKGRLRDTLLFVMGNHGPSNSDVTSTLQGQLEERLPLMAIVLPEVLKRDRPEALSNLQSNVDTVATPHDIYATILDALDMQEFMNPYKVKGADLTRALSLLNRIPKTRSCSEAGIEPHWCACVSWINVSNADPIYMRAANALLDHINSVTEFMRSKCALRTLTSVEWVMLQISIKKQVTFQEAKDANGYVAKYKGDGTSFCENFLVKIVVGPDAGVYVGAVTYMKSENNFTVLPEAISRTNAYNEESSCLTALYPHLNMFCYCY